MSDLMGRLRSLAEYYDQSIPPGLIDGGGNGSVATEPPRITSVNPTEAAEGTQLEIFGTGLNGVTQVQFGSTATGMLPATAFTIVPDGTGWKINVTIPPTGVTPGFWVDVSVTNSLGSNTNTAAFRLAAA